MYGILLVDKPKGMTSNRVVTAVKRRFGVKVGHAGTLDPLATGVLPLLVGEATKIASHLLHDRKVYETVMHLGVVTDTLDAEGQVTDRRPVPELTAGDMKSVLDRFVGDSEQIPPAFSAIKIDGRRAYSLARSGREVAIPSRKVTVYSMELRAMDLPRVTVRMEVSGGTYVRALVRDIGQALGCGAHVEELRRLVHGPFRVERAWKMGDIMNMDPESFAGALRPMFAAFPDVPKMIIDRFTAWTLLTGRTAEETKISEDDHMVVLLGDNGHELGLGTIGKSGLKPLKIFGKFIQEYVEDRRKENVQ